jgi:mRNA-degrading endonuclease RelE of RelBE toxin-antitoxin system
MYAIRFAVDVTTDLKKLSAYRRKILLEAIETQLS